MNDFLAFIEKDIATKKLTIQTLPIKTKTNIKKFNETIETYKAKYEEYRSGVRNYLLAKSRSFEIKDILVSKHPKLANEIYITYTSPFWKVRIGNCQTNAKAQELRQWIIAEFPEFTTETYIVPSMIYVY
mgnify:CR=1 FL=1